MNDPTSFNKAENIVVHRVLDRARLRMLPQLFGSRTMRVESLVYDRMSEFVESYDGGFWEFYQLSNGGFYMAPRMPEVQVVVASNGFEGMLSADAAGITVCLFTYSHLAFEVEGDIFARHFHWLRAFALEHTEALQILAAID